jgi:hypothetical protein
MTRPQDNLPTTARMLGYAGLIPFCGLPIAMLLWPAHLSLWLNLLANYALAILCFLPGVWWGLALIRRSSAALLASNALVVATFLGKSLLGEQLFLLQACAMFCLLLVFERAHPMFGRQPAYYSRMRLQLTVVACVGLLVGWMATAELN